MKIRLTIPMIAFALALAGMSVRAHTCPTTANSAVTASSATHCQAAPVTGAYQRTADRSMPPASATRAH